MAKPKSLVEFAYDKIKDKILTGNLVPGQKLKTKTMADDLDISHTPVKEAFNRLVAEGFIESIPMQGYYVSQFTLQDFLDMIAVRVMMETAAVKPSIQHHMDYPHKLKRIEKLLEVYDHPEHLTYKTATKLEQEFHTLMIELSGNKRLAKLYHTDWSMSLLYYFYNRIEYPLDELIVHYKSHRILYNALREKDAPRMTCLIEETMNDVLTRLVPLIKEHDNGIFLPQEK